MYCIKCGARIDELVNCPVCGANLTGEHAGEFEEYSIEDLYDAAGLDWGMREVIVAANTAEASAARGLLEAHGVPVEARASGNSAPELGVLVEGIALLVPEPMVDYSKELLSLGESAVGRDADAPETSGCLKDTELIHTARSFGIFSVIAGILAVGLKALRARIDSA